MSNLTETQRQHLIDLLERGEDLPLDYKHLLFPPERQEYELVYAGKEREEDILAETMSVPLQPLKAFGGNGSDSWPNMLIFGDNLQAMKALLRLKEEGKLVNADGSRGVKLVYIDPPFATRQEFRGQDEQAYQDKVIGAKFLEFLRKRLIFIHELLSLEGSLFLHCDYRKGHYIKLILDEVFGESNFRNEILVRRTQKNLQHQFDKVRILNVAVDSLFWYSKRSGQRFSKVERAVYLEADTDNWHGLWKGVDRPTMRYELLGETIETGQWMWSKERAYRAVKNYQEWEAHYSHMMTLYEYWVETGKKLDFIRANPNTFTPEYWVKPKSVVPTDSKWMDIPAYGDQKYYPTCKSEALLDRIVRHLSNSGDIVLDAFVGSGTTLAVAEKLGRRWIGIDCGKLAIYTIQKRLFNLRKEIGNKGQPLKAKPFTLYHAGLYDFAQLKRLPWEDWRFFALHLFQCRDESHTVGGIELDGYRGADHVLVFKHLLGGGVSLDYGFIDDLHHQVGSKLGSRFFIIAPAASVTFLEDYIDAGHTRYYILRIPYSIINELHSRDFASITQPLDESQVNETVEAVGFDFMWLPEVVCQYLIKPRSGELIDEAIIQIQTFKSRAMVKGATQKGNWETLSMVMVDYDYPVKEPTELEPPPFEMNQVFYAKDLAQNGWEVRLPMEALGQQVMIIYLDIYGNEFREIKARAEFQRVESAS